LQLQNAGNPDLAAGADCVAVCEDSAQRKTDLGDGKELDLKPIAWISGLADGLRYLSAADREAGCGKFDAPVAVYSFTISSIDGRTSFALFRPLLASSP